MAKPTIGTDRDPITVKLDDPNTVVQLPSYAATIREDELSVVVREDDPSARVELFNQVATIQTLSDSATGGSVPRPISGLSASSSSVSFDASADENAGEGDIIEYAIYVGDGEPEVLYEIVDASGNQTYTLNQTIEYDVIGVVAIDRGRQKSTMITAQISIGTDKALELQDGTGLQLQDGTYLELNI